MDEKHPRFWCHYEVLEEFHAGMWVKVSGAQERALWLAVAVTFLKDSNRMRSSMREVLKQWPTSCKAAFTNPSLNKPVWLAHAGACLTTGLPEEFMRKAYWELPEDERERADKDASEIAEEWRYA